MFTLTCAFVVCNTDGVVADLQKIVTETDIAEGVTLGPVPVPHDATTPADIRTTNEVGVDHGATPLPLSTPQERTETERRANDQRNHLQNLTKIRQRRLNQAKTRKRR